MTSFARYIRETRSRAIEFGARAFPFLGISFRLLDANSAARGSPAFGMLVAQLADRPAAAAPHRTFES
jgi:hypothetical protein